MAGVVRHLTRIADLSRAELGGILELADDYRRLNAERPRRRLDVLGGRVVAMVFEKPSLRTKVTFEIATLFLGGYPVFLSSDQIFSSGQNQKGRESVPDIAKNLERFSDVIVARVYDHQTIRQLATEARIPVINALCDMHHPCQAITDVLTIEALAKKKSRRLKIAYVGDGNNVATSLLQACALRGHDISIASPPNYTVPDAEQEVALGMVALPEQRIVFGHEPQAAVRDADVIYTDTFVSMGDEDEKDVRAQAFAGYQVDMQLMKRASPDAVFMHCLPAHRGEEVTDEVMDSKQSVVFDQAENRLYAAQAVLHWCTKGGRC